MIDKMRELTDRQMQDFVRVLEKRRVPLHSVLIAQHGKLIFEKYYAPYCRNKLQRMFSVTKSFTSLAIGLLEQEDFPAGSYLRLFPGISSRSGTSLAGRDDD